MNNNSNDVNNGKHVFECPNCCYPLMIGEKDTIAKCPCCGNVVNITAPKDTTDKSLEKVNGIKTISAAKAHINFLFEHYDWEAFGKNPSLYTIKEIDVLLDNMKTIQGDDKETWKTCFNYLYMCITQKIKNIDINLNSIVDRYVSGGEVNTCHNNFDSLKESVFVLVNNKTKYIDELKGYKEYSARFGLDEKDIEKMDKELEQIQKDLNSLTIVNSLEDHPIVAAKIMENTQKQEEEYSKKGINAVELYNQGINSFKDKNYMDALDAFVKIKDYKDANKYISKMTTLKYCGSDMYCHEKVYFYRNKTLYAEKGGLIDYNNPQTAEFDTHIGSYGDLFHYFDVSGKSITHYFDMTKDNFQKKKKKVYKTNFVYGDLTLYKCCEVPDKNIYLLKYDPINNAKDKQLFLKTYGQKSELTVNKKINYRNDWSDLLELDLKTGDFKIILEGVTSVIKYNEDVIYYIAPNPVYKKEKIVDYNGASLYAFDRKTGEKKLQVSGNSIIQRINKDNSIVFTRFDHGEDNMSIYTKKSIDSNEETEIVQNVYKFYKIINNKIFYLVGNSNIKALRSINIDGTDCKEIQKYMQDIVFSDEDWLYFVRGDSSSKYCTLYRMPVDGGASNKVAFGINKGDLQPETLTIVNGYLYFTNYQNVLCRVRLNGTGYQELVPDVYEILTIKFEKVFYLCKDVDNGNKSIKSIYCMELDGSNRQKLVHNLSQISSLDDETLLYIRSEKLASKKELYNEVKDPKLNKIINKAYKKYAKKKKNPETIFPVLYKFDCQSMRSTPIAYEVAYPTKKDIKVEMKEVLSK